MNASTYRCLIVDDEPLAIRLLKAHVDRIPGLVVAATFENPIDTLAYLRNNEVDLLLLDIQMPVLTGIELARTLKNKPAIIFTTAYRDYAVESYEMEVVDYLVKPIAFARFYQAIDRFFRSRDQGQAPLSQPQPATPFNPEETGAAYRYFNVNKRHIKVFLKDITYVESLKDYIRICTQDQKLVTKEKISDFAASLPAYFLRTHRSFIVNTQHITAYTAHEIEIGAERVPIGVSYKMEVMKKLKPDPN